MKIALRLSLAAALLLCVQGHEAAFASASSPNLSPPHHKLEEAAASSAAEAMMKKAGGHHIPGGIEILTEEEVQERFPPPHRILTAAAEGDLSEFAALLRQLPSNLPFIDDKGKKQTNRIIFSSKKELRLKDINHIVDVRCDLPLLKESHVLVTDINNGHRRRRGGFFFFVNAAGRWT